MRISVFGMGYVGVVSGACLAKIGHHVVGVDVNPAKVGLINAAQAPIVEHGIQEIIAETVGCGRLSATTDPAEAVERSDVSFVSVGTPSQANGRPAFDAIDTVIDEIGRAIQRKSTPHVVVIRSTVPPGTTEERVVPALCRSSGREIGPELDVCNNPEFLREGSAVRDFGKPAFTLVGSMGDAAFEAMKTIYAAVDAPLIRTHVRAAESIKYLCNIFHAVKIGFANEIGAVLKSFGLDSREAMRIFCEDRTLNISSAYLRPGFAFGGSCLPKDIRAFLSVAHAQGVEIPLINNLLLSNERHIERAFQMIARGGRRKVAMFGLAFKPGTDDLRESPLVLLAERLIGKGFDLAILDRHVEFARLVGSNRDFIDREIPHLERLLKPNVEETLDGAGVIVIGHADPSDIETVRQLHGGRTIVDLQGAKLLEQLPGIDYQGICW